MKNLIEFIAKSLVDNPQNLVILENQTDNENKIELLVPQAEIGKVIGKHGQMADSIRTIANFHASKILKKPSTFLIVENTQTH